MPTIPNLHLAKLSTIIILIIHYSN